MQLFWILVGLAIFKIAWKHALSGAFPAVAADERRSGSAGCSSSVGVMNELQYRVNFALQLSSRLLALASGSPSSRSSTRTPTELNGWSQAELLCLLGIQILMAGLDPGAHPAEHDAVTEEVRDGKLDHALTKPDDSQVLVSVREVEDLAGGRRDPDRRDRPRFALSGSQPTSGSLDALAFALSLAARRAC